MERRCVEHHGDIKIGTGLTVRTVYAVSGAAPSSLLPAVRIISIQHMGKLTVFGCLLASTFLEGSTDAKLAIWSLALVLAFTRTFTTTTFTFSARWAIA